MSKKNIKKQLKEEGDEKKYDIVEKRVDYKLRNYTEDNLIEDIAKLKKQIDKVLQSINQHDQELEVKRNNHKELTKELQELEKIKELLVQINI